MNNQAYIELMLSRLHVLIDTTLTDKERELKIKHIDQMIEELSK